MIGEEVIFPFDDHNNPAYGINGGGGSSGISTCSNSESDDYLSVSVNPNYQFIGHAASAPTHTTSINNIKATSVDFDISRHYTDKRIGVPIPLGTSTANSRSSRNDSFRLQLLDQSLLSSTPYPLSTSAPPQTTSPDSAIITDTTNIDQSQMTTLNETAITTIEDIDTTSEQPSYSYARTGVFIQPSSLEATTGYVNSIEASTGYVNSSCHDLGLKRLNPRPNQYTPNPTTKFDVQENDRKRSSSTSTNRSKRGSRLLYLRYRREIPDFKLELMIVLFSVLAIIVSIVAITLCVVILFSDSTMSTSTQSNTGQVVVINSGGETNPTIIPSTTTQSPVGNDKCNCTAPMPNNAEFADSLFQQLQFIRDRLNILRNQPSNFNSSLDQLSIYLTHIKSINESLQQFRPQVNQPRYPMLTGLNHTADITVNYDDCIENVSRCGSKIFFRPNSGQPVGICDTDVQPYIVNQTYIMVAKSCVVTAGFNTGTLSEPTGAYLNVDLGGHSGNTLYERLQTAQVSCRCLNYNSQLPECLLFTKLCSYTKGNVRVSLSFHSSSSL